MKKPPADQLLKRIKERKARLGIVGLGYVGLPLAVEFARAGFHVTGIDLDARRVAQVNKGKSYILDIKDADLAPLVKEGRLAATSDAAVLAGIDAVSICVPTPLGKTRDPDISYVVSAAEMIAKHVHPGMLVVLESTSYPGTTAEVVQPRLAAGGLTVGEDFYLAFSPERVDPGNARYTIRNTPKVVGGTTVHCLEAAKLLYEQIIERVVPVRSPETAEMVKLLENTFRSVNIALVNEVAIMCDRLGIDVWEVMDAASTKPFGFMPFYPGPGLGGHCLPIDPLYLAWKLKSLNYTARFIELASEINSKMPQFVSFKIADRLNDAGKCVKGANVLVLGVAYKRDINDWRESPALDIIRFLQLKGAKVGYSDPHVPELSLEGGHAMRSMPLTPDMLASQDLVVIVTDHRAFDYDAIVRHAPLIIDTRNATRSVTSGREKISRL